jgi:hypothetical protein
MAYDKMSEFIAVMLNVFKMVNKMSLDKNDKKCKYISILICNYVLKIAKDNNIELTAINNADESINLIPFFEYISHNNIELYDFKNIEISDVDTNKQEDIERFVLSHVYYITQK